MPAHSSASRRQVADPKVEALLPLWVDFALVLCHCAQLPAARPLSELGLLVLRPELVHRRHPDFPEATESSTQSLGQGPSFVANCLFQQSAVQSSVASPGIDVAYQLMKCDLLLD